MLDKRDLQEFLSRKVREELKNYLPKLEKSIGAEEADRWVENAILEINGDVEAGEQLTLNAGDKKSLSLKVKDDSHNHNISTITNFDIEATKAVNNNLSSKSDNLTITFAGNEIGLDLEQGAGSGLDADTVRGVTGDLLINKNTLTDEMSTRAPIGWHGHASTENETALRWTRISTSLAADPSSMILSIKSGRSGYHSIAVVAVQASYGQDPTITLLSASHYNGGCIKKIVLEYNNTYDNYVIFVQGTGDYYTYSASNVLRFSKTYANNVIPSRKQLTMDLSDTEKRFDVIGGEMYYKGVKMENAFAGGNADTLNGQNGAFYRDASNLNAGTIEPALLPTGSLTAKGVLQLSNSIASTSQTTAASSYAVRVAYNKANHGHPYIPTSSVLCYVQDGDGTNVSIGLGSSLKFKEGTNVDINFTDTSPGSPDDLFDLTISVPNASTDKIGAVRLSTSVSSTSNTTAATSSAVRAAYNLAKSGGAGNTWGSNGNGKWWKCGSTGVIIQVGYTTCWKKSVVTTFPIPFPSAAWSVIPCDYYQDDTRGIDYCAAMTKRPTKTTVTWSTNDSIWYIYYIAIGK